MSSNNILNFAEALRVIPKMTSQGNYIIAIDGLGGSGKGTLTAELAKLIQNAKIISTDYLYDFSTWDKENAMDYYNWHYLLEEVLLPLKSGNQISTDLYDLFPPREKIGTVVVKPGDVLIIEGIGTLNRHLREFYDLSIWVEAPKQIAMQRALKRDIDQREDEGGEDDVRRFWKRWEPLMQQYVNEEKPQEIADMVVQNETSVLLYLHPFSKNPLSLQ